jgi:hypothetical protein
MKKEKALNKFDYSKKENQIGCGYCAHEHICLKHKAEPRVNLAKEGCKEWLHWEDMKRD